VGKGWSVFFGVVLFGTFIIWFIAPFYGWWLPENVSSFGGDVDNLFYLIFWFVGFFFVLTEAILVYAMWKFAARPGEKAIYTHGNHRLEMMWTAVPAAILLFIAVAQISVWEDIKYQKQMPSPDLIVSVLARQWEWRLRYPQDNTRFHYDEKDADDKAKKSLVARAWAENPEFDDVHTTNELHCWAGIKDPITGNYKGGNVKLYMRTQDVIHSFTLPNLRLKQDTLPGKTIPMWFQATKANTRFDPTTGKLEELNPHQDRWEIACQELCGGRHYAMRGRFYVHEDKKSYEAWLAHARKQQESRTPGPAVALNP
jgi:cytochrome c oxidase subunit 2